MMHLFQLQEFSQKITEVRTLGDFSPEGGGLCMDSIYKVDLSMQGKRKHHYVQRFHGHQGMNVILVTQISQTTKKPQTIQPPSALLLRMSMLEGFWDADYCSSKEPEHDKS